MEKTIFRYIETMFKISLKQEESPMEKNHKRALIAIFSFLFVCLVLATVFVSSQTQSVGISSILIVVTAILAIDIGWVMKSETAHNPEELSR